MKNSDSVYQLYGEVAWLWSNSELHLNWSIRTQATLIIPPIKLNQFIMLYDENKNPIAYSSWAFFDETAEANYILHPGQIQPNSWNNGDRLWFIDFVSPFSKLYTLKLRRQLSSLFPTSVGAALRVRPQNEVGKIITFNGIKLSQNKAIEMRSQRLQAAKAALRSHPDRDKSFKLNFD